jgi:hypothetical protein
MEVAPSGLDGQAPRGGGVSSRQRPCSGNGFAQAICVLRVTRRPAHARRRKRATQAAMVALALTSRLVRLGDAGVAQSSTEALAAWGLGLGQRLAPPGREPNRRLYLLRRLSRATSRARGTGGPASDRASSRSAGRRPARTRLGLGRHDVEPQPAELRAEPVHVLEVTRGLPDVEPSLGASSRTSRSGPGSSRCPRDCAGGVGLPYHGRRSAPARWAGGRLASRAGLWFLAYYLNRLLSRVVPSTRQWQARRASRRHSDTRASSGFRQSHQSTCNAFSMPKRIRWYLS